MKKFIAVWGDWEFAINTYDATYKVSYISDFTSDMGYSQEEIKTISTLGIGEKWESELGNHLIVRIS